MAKSLSPAQKAQKEYQEKKKKQQQTYTPGGAKNYSNTKKNNYDTSTAGLSANQRAQKAYQEKKKAEQDKKKTADEVKLRKQVNSKMSQDRATKEQGFKTAAGILKNAIGEMTGGKYWYDDNSSKQTMKRKERTSANTSSREKLNNKYKSSSSNEPMTREEYEKRKKYDKSFSSGPNGYWNGR